MTPLGHASIGFIVGTVFARNLGQFPMNSVILSVTAGAVLLDLDLIYRFVQKGSKVFDKTIGKHRYFPTHTPAFSLLISLVLSLFSLTLGIFFFIGCLLHLFIDTLFFPEGIMFFYPFSKKTYYFLTIKTHKFWAPKRISQVNGWYKNYFRSPLFWIFEIGPTIMALALFFR